MDLFDIFEIAAPAVGGFLQSRAAQNAAEAQQAGGNQAIGVYQNALAQARSDFEPFRQLGLTGVNEMQNALAYLKSPFQYQEEPGYQFGLAEGEKAIDRNAGARGRRYSGATLKALQRFSQDYAGTKYNEAFNRDRATKDALYNQLAGIINAGMGAAGSTGTFQVNAGNNIANALMGNADVGAEAGIASSGALTRGIYDALGAYRNQRMYNALGIAV